MRGVLRPLRVFELSIRGSDHDRAPHADRVTALRSDSPPLAVARMAATRSAEASRADEIDGELWRVGPRGPLVSAYGAGGRNWELWDSSVPQPSCQMEH
jgi:hypothetical protein